MNTGKGVLLAGGTKFVYGLNSEPAVEIVRLVDPTTMTTKAVALPDNVKLSENWYASAYDEQGCGYLFSGTSTKGFYKFSFDNGEATCQVLEEGSVFGEKDGGSHALSVQVEGSMSVDQAKRMVAGPTKNGIIASGPTMTDSAGVVIADTYSLDWGRPSSRQLTNWSASRRLATKSARRTVATSTL